MYRPHTAGEVVEQAVNGYCSFESAEAFSVFAQGLTAEARQFWEVLRAGRIFPRVGVAAHCSRQWRVVGGCTMWQRIC